MSKVRRQLHWNLVNTAVKVNAGLKTVNSQSHKPLPLLHLYYLTELETKRFYFFKRRFRALLWGSQIITLCREHNSGTKLFLCSVWAPKELYHIASFQHSWRRFSCHVATVKLLSLQTTMQNCASLCRDLLQQPLEWMRLLRSFHGKDTWQHWGGVCITQVLSKCVHSGWV